MSPTILADLTELFRDLFEDDNLVLQPTTSAADVEGWDSLAHVRLIVLVEKRFGVRFSSREVAGLKNVGELIELIERKQK